MNASWKIGTFRGIPIGFHWSMLLVFFLLVSSLSTAFFPMTHPDLADAAYVVMAIVAALLFFASILLHELGHSVAAQRNGLSVNGITLFIFGGVAQLEGRARSATVELKIAAAGPIVSLALALLFWLISLATDAVAYLQAPAAWLAGLNLTLALFNLLPGFPLDGGRILRALVWRYTGSEERAAQVAQVSGQLLAFGMMGIGALWAFNGNFSNGLWLVFLGWFLQNAAATEAAGSRMELALRGAKVAHAMGPPETVIPSRMKLRQLVEEYVLNRGESYFIVMDDDLPRGVVTLADLGKVPQSRLDWESVSTVMTPWDRLTRVTPQTDLLDAIQLMDDARVNQLPVMDGEQPRGLLTREEVIHYLRLRMNVGNR
jgi:Zn-dependent protease